MSVLPLTDEDLEARTLLILRAAGQDGFLLHDAHNENKIRATLGRSLLPHGLARVEGRGRKARAFITPAGLAKSVGEGA